ncbi:MAG TPA: ATP-binding protein [Candidatus Xenobia bacterium]|nr:ATP-binding protein [Candidatus Xenobia bacterium]
MSAEPRRVQVTLESRIESVDLGEELARGMAGAAGLDEDEQYKLSMAVREVLINALEHGNRGDASKAIGLGFSLSGDRLVVEVRDQGKGFDLTCVPDPRQDENLLRTSGRGLFLVRCFVDDLQVRSNGTGGATVTITKRISSNDKGSSEPNSQKEKQS